MTFVDDFESDVIASFLFIEVESWDIYTNEQHGGGEVVVLVFPTIMKKVGRPH